MADDQAPTGRPSPRAEAEATKLLEELDLDRWHPVGFRSPIKVRAMMRERLARALDAARAEERAERERLHRALYVLAMMGLQSERYRIDADYRDAVDDALEIERAALRARGEEAK